MDNYATIATKLQGKERFTGNSLSAYWCAFTGLYTVKSYSTTIATYNTETGQLWVEPTKYSNTTSRHQNLIRRAWGLN
jgi:hypothetical protein